MPFAPRLASEVNVDESLDESGKGSPSSSKAPRSADHESL